MRPSNYEKILDAAMRVIERDGITALTFDAVAAESGVTRGGIIYHFESRDALLEGIHGHVADQWEADLRHQLGDISPEDATADQRLTAYIRTCARPALRADLQLALEQSARDHDASWQELLHRWSPALPTPGTDDPRFLARLAADGLWLHEALSKSPLTESQREQAAEAIIDALVTPPSN